MAADPDKECARCWRGGTGPHAEDCAAPPVAEPVEAAEGVSARDVLAWPLGVQHWCADPESEYGERPCHICADQARDLLYTLQAAQGGGRFTVIDHDTGALMRVVRPWSELRNRDIVASFTPVRSEGGADNGN